MPSRCACGENFKVAHALHCPKDGYTHIRHNDIRDSFANLLNEFCDDVEVEPCLQSLQGKTFANRTATIDDDAGLDIKANGFFDSRFNRTLFNVKVFNAYAKSCPRSIPDSYKYHESIKKLKYEKKIMEVEKATFCPLEFACTGGPDPSASNAVQSLASRTSDKKEDSYSDVIKYIGTKLNFALLRSSILCLHGARSGCRRPAVEASIGTIVEEGAVSLNAFFLLLIQSHYTLDPNCYLPYLFCL